MNEIGEFKFLSLAGVKRLFFFAKNKILNST